MKTKIILTLLSVMTTLSVFSQQDKAFFELNSLEIVKAILWTIFVKVLSSIDKLTLHIPKVLWKTKMFSVCSV